MLDILSTLLSKFCEEEELERESADEMLLGLELTEYQVGWLEHFVFLWDITAEEANRKWQHNRTILDEPIIWQAMNTGGGCMCYGADFATTNTICLSDECIVVIEKEMNFVTYWTEEYNDGAHDAGMMWLGKDTTICDFHAFLARFDLESYMLEIFQQFKKIGGLG